MISLFAIMRYYSTIIRDYVYDYFTIIFPIITDYTRLLLRLFPIISGRRHPKDGNVQTAILDPRVSVDDECLLICIDWKARRQHGKLPDGACLYHYTHYFFYYAHYLTWLNRIAAPVSTFYALRFYANPFCV